MALVLNYNRNASGFRGRQLGTTGLGGVLIGWDSPGRRKNRTINWGGIQAGNTASVPNGRTHPSAWLLPQRTGGISSYRGIVGSSSVSAATVQIAQIAASIISAASTSFDAYSRAYISADITPFTTLSPQSLATAVWSALASENNLAGSMGALLNASGDPWVEVIEDGLDAKNAMRLVVSAVAGKLSGANSSTITIRNAVADDKDRIVASVDVDGNRSSITYDLTD